VVALEDRTSLWSWNTQTKTITSIPSSDYFK